MGFVALSGGLICVAPYFPHSIPQPLSRPAGRERGALNSPYGRVFKVGTYTGGVALGWFVDACYWFAWSFQLVYWQLPTARLQSAQRPR